MKIIIGITIFILIFNIATKKYRNPYKLYMVFGKKGSGKSSYLVRKAIYYQKKGFVVYTNMSDCCIKDIRIINPADLGDFVPCNNSCLLLDEVGMLYDNRNFKNFREPVRDFFKLQRHYKVVCYLASQTFDIDKKLRDLTDEMYLVSNIATVFSLVRPIRKSVTLTEATSDGESRIAENLKFRMFTSWKVYYIPKTIKYFESFKVPVKEEIKYNNPVNVIEVKKDDKKKNGRIKFKFKRSKRKNKNTDVQTSENNDRSGESK